MVAHVYHKKADKVIRIFRHTENGWENSNTPTTRKRNYTYNEIYVEPAETFLGNTHLKLKKKKKREEEESTNIQNITHNNCRVFLLFTIHALWLACDHFVCSAANFYLSFFFNHECCTNSTKYSVPDKHDCYKFSAVLSYLLALAFT